MGQGQASGELGGGLAVPYTDETEHGFFARHIFFERNFRSAYLVHEKLGSGGFATVYRVTPKDIAAHSALLSTSSQPQRPSATMVKTTYPGSADSPPAMPPLQPGRRSSVSDAPASVDAGGDEDPNRTILSIDSRATTSPVAPRSGSPPARGWSTRTPQSSVRKSTGGIGVVNSSAKNSVSPDKRRLSTASGVGKDPAWENSEGPPPAPRRASANPMASTGPPSSSRAAKVIDKRRMQRLGVKKQQVLHEIRMLYLARGHENILQIHEAFESEHEYSFVLEYCSGGDLQSRVSDDVVLPESLIALWMCQVLESVRYLHSLDVVHRDVKPHNFMFAGDGRTLKLGDFGVAVELQRRELEDVGKAGGTGRCGKEEEQAVLLRERIGTPAFMAPEMHLLPKASPGYGKKVDVWAAGVTFVFLLSNSCPFVDGNNRLLREELIRGEVPLWDVGREGAGASRNTFSSGGSRGGSGRSSGALLGSFVSLFQSFGGASGGAGKSGTNQAEKKKKSAERRLSALAKQFARALLHPDPDLRLDAQAACAHQWVYVAGSGALDHAVTNGGRNTRSNLDASNVKHDRDHTYPQAVPHTPEEEKAARAQAQLVVEADNDEPLLRYEDFENLLQRNLRKTVDGAARLSKYLGNQIGDGSGVVLSFLGDKVDQAVDALDAAPAVDCSANNVFDREKGEACGICYQELSGTQKENLLDFVCPRCKYVCCRDCFAKLARAACPFCKLDVGAAHVLAKAVVGFSERTSEVVKGADRLVAESEAWMEKRASSVSARLGIRGGEGGGNGGSAASYVTSAASASTARRASHREEGRAPATGSQQGLSAAPASVAVKTDECSVCGCKDGISDWDFTCPECCAPVCAKCVAGAPSAAAADEDAASDSSTRTQFEDEDDVAVNLNTGLRQCAVCACGARFRQAIAQHLVIGAKAERARRWSQEVANNVRGELAGADFGGLRRELAKNLQEDVTALGSWLGGLFTSSEGRGKIPKIRVDRAAEENRSPGSGSAEGAVPADAAPEAETGKDAEQGDSE